MGDSVPALAKHKPPAREFISIAIDNPAELGPTLNPRAIIAVSEAHFRAADGEGHVFQAAGNVAFALGPILVGHDGADIAIGHPFLGIIALDEVGIVDGHFIHGFGRGVFQHPLVFGGVLVRLGAQGQDGHDGAAAIAELGKFSPSSPSNSGGGKGGKQGQDDEEYRPWFA